MGITSSSSITTNTTVIELTGKIMVVAIILLFFIIFFVFCIHLYSKWFWYNHHQEIPTSTRRRRRLDFAAGHQEITLVSPLRQGLDKSLLKTIPVLIFDLSKNEGEPLECSVCLCEVCNGEKIRFLPKCDHGFHVDCIDMWFQSHSTCPLCRNPVLSSSRKEDDDCSGEGLRSGGEVVVSNRVESVGFYLGEGPSFPTNVLCWGDESRVSVFGNHNVDDHRRVVINGAETSSSSMGGVVGDVAREMSEEGEEGEEKSAVSTRLRSLKRLLSGTSRRVNPSSSVGNSDLESQS